MSRRKGRILAFQSLYSWDASGASVDSLMDFSWEKTQDSDGDNRQPSKNEQEEYTFARLIVAGTIDHIDEIDKLIEDHLSPKWTKDRINRVTLAILRTSIYEMLFQHSSKSIVIDEAVNIAKKYGADDAYKFINAMLDKIGDAKDDTKEV